MILWLWMSGKRNVLVCRGHELANALYVYGQPNILQKSVCYRLRVTTRAQLFGKCTWLLHLLIDKGLPQPTRDVSLHTQEDDIVILTWVLLVFKQYSILVGSTSHAGWKLWMLLECSQSWRRDVLHVESRKMQGYNGSLCEVYTYSVLDRMPINPI